METITYQWIVKIGEGCERGFAEEPTAELLKALSDEYDTALTADNVEKRAIATGKTATEVREEISEAFSNEYRKLWAAHGYESAWEVEQYANTKGHKYQTEAQAIKDWRIATWDLIEAADITAVTDVKEFIANIPKLEI